MAVVINIPNIGSVTATNAATESTLQELVRIQSQATGQQARINQRIETNFRSAAASASEVAQSVEQVGSATQRNVNEIIGMNRSLASVQADWMDRLSMGPGIFSGLYRGIGNLTASVIEATTAYARNYRQLSENPVAAASTMISKGLGLANAGLQGLGEGIQNVARNIPGLGTVTGIAGAGVKAGGALLTSTLDMVNQVFAEEMEQTIAGFKAMTAQGAIFANGLDDMRLTALKSGTTMDRFQAGIQRTGRDLNNMGLSFTGAMQTVADTMYEFDKIAGNSGNSLRAEFMALGYSYEEQVEVTASFLAQMKAGLGTQSLATMSYKDLAKMTRDYAGDLKVLQTITGEDAKAKQEQARIASMQADIMSKLDPEEAQKFQAVFRSLPQDLQKGFLEQMSSGVIVDPITNIALSQSQELSNMFQSSMDMIYDSSKDASSIQDEMLKFRARVRQEIADAGEGGFGDTFSQVARLTSDSMASGVAQIFNDFLVNPITEDAVDTARDALNKQAEIQSELTQSVIKLQMDANTFAVSMEEKIIPYMGLYAGLLSSVNGVMMGIVDGGVEMAAVMSTARMVESKDKDGNVTRTMMVTDKGVDMKMTEYLESLVPDVTSVLNTNPDAETPFFQGIRESISNGMIDGWKGIKEGLGFGDDVPDNNVRGNNQDDTISQSQDTQLKLMGVLGDLNAQIALLSDPAYKEKQLAIWQNISDNIVVVKNNTREQIDQANA